MACYEVWVDMDPLFYKQYLNQHENSGLNKAKIHRLRQHLWVMNPKNVQLGNTKFDGES